MAKRRKPLDEQLRAAREQGATHLLRIDPASCIRLYRERAGSWQGRSLDGDADGWMFTGSWCPLAGGLPRTAERIEEAPDDS